MADPAEGEGPAPSPSPSSPLLERLVWEPSWRERLGALLGGTSPLRLAAVAVASVALAAVVAVAVLREPAPLPELSMPVAGGPGDPAATTTTTTAAVEPPAVEVVVHAAGAVMAPGLHRLPPGARVADLLDVAGGPAPGADLDRLNLAAPLVDGERIFVPMPDQAVPVAEGSGPVPTGPGAGGTAGASAPRSPVDLNRATLADLEALPGVGPATAQAILDERARRGRFGSVDELLEVRGIGDAKLAALRDLARV